MVVPSPDVDDTPEECEVIEVYKPVEEAEAVDEYAEVEAQPPTDSNDFWTALDAAAAMSPPQPERHVSPSIQQTARGYLTAAQEELTREEQSARQENRTYVDRLIDSAPGSSELREQSGLNIDLTELTIAGWILSVLTILLTSTAVIVPFVIAASNGSRFSGGIARAIAIPMAIVIGGGTFWVGRMILRAMNVPIVRSE